MTAMTITLITALFLGSILSFDRNLNVERATFNLWKLRYNKSYATLEEEESRFANFQASVTRVRQLQQTSAKRGGAQFGLTKFADLSVEEFRRAMLMPRRTPDLAARKKRPAPKPLGRLRASPSTFDWRAQGKVTPVKNQEQCGSCWAFSATETIESAWMLKHKLNNATMQPLAPQQIVDCDWYCLGCGGGQAFSALDYVLGAGGLETNANYPYQGVNGNCQFDSSKVYAKISTWEWACSIENEQELLDNTYNHGPTSICVDATNWQDYVSGVMTASQCAWINQLDHCVQAVGWNRQANPPYWIVRNSWTTQWGEDGYIRLEYGQNTCGLTYDATYVIAA